MFFCLFSPVCYFCGVLYFESTRSVLAHKESQYRLLADNAVDAIYRYRLLPETKFEYISHAIFEITGYTPEEFYANPILYTSLIHPDDLPLFIGHTGDSTIPDNLPLEYRINQKCNRIVYIEHKYHFIHDDAGGAVREGIIRDVTSRNYMQQIETQLDRVNMVGEMTVTIAHEVCNPLTTIRGYLQFSQKRLTISEERLNLMIEELDRITSIINEYLLLAQNKRVNLKKCCLNSLIISWLPLMKAYATFSNVHIKLELENTPRLLLDKNEIRYLIINLARNGVEAMSAGGELTIGTKLDKHQVILSIKDQGNGIPVHVRELHCYIQRSMKRFININSQDRPLSGRLVLPL
jgi:two-component system sporulation sensor kinase C